MSSASPEAKASEGVEVIELVHKSGRSKARISPYGATVLTWKIFETDMLFLSSKASLAGDKAIRGGIPLVFPQFGPGKLKQHGFARTSMWSKEGEVEHDLASGDCSVTLKLVSSDATRVEWPHDFELLYKVTLGMTNLTTQLTCNNTGSTSFDFTALLHTYFKVDDIAKATVFGLGGLDYLDTADHKTRKTEGNTVITFDGEVDRVYLRGSGIVDARTGRPRAEELVMVGDGGNCDVVVKTANLTDVVVWNPGKAKSDSMGDMEADGFRRFVCVEAGSVAAPVTLAAGKQWSAGQSLTLRVLQQAGRDVATKYGPKMDRISGLPAAAAGGKGSPS